MEENKVFDAYFEMPDGYQVQLMVLKDFPGGKQKRGTKMNVFRSRIWVGNAAEPEPLVYRSQEHADLHIAIDACYSMMLAAARVAVHSPVAQEAVRKLADRYFDGAVQAAL